MNAAFVAEARRVYVPAAAWMRANGWGHDHRNRDRRLAIGYSLGNSGIYADRPYVTVERRAEFGTFAGNDLVAEPTTLTQAVDYLVTAGILPGPLHSLMQVDAETAAYEATMPEVYGNSPMSIVVRDELANLQQACATEGHQMAVYRRDRNDSVCLCGQAMELGDFRQKAQATS